MDSPLSVLYQHTVPHSISTAMYCGQLLAGIQTGDTAMIDEALPYANQLQGLVLGFGKVLAVTETATGGFDFGKVVVTDQQTGSIITIMNQNENLIAFSGDSETPLCCAPDAICYVDDHLHPLTNDEIKEGMQVYILAVKGRPQLYQAHILNGFRRLLASLGYAGKRTDLEESALQPLGMLLQEISKA